MRAGFRVVDRPLQAAHPIAARSGKRIGMQAQAQRTGRGRIAAFAAAFWILLLLIGCTNSPKP